MSASLGTPQLHLYWIMYTPSALWSRTLHHLTKDTRGKPCFVVWCCRFTTFGINGKRQFCKKKATRWQQYALRFDTWTLLTFKFSFFEGPVIRQDWCRSFRTKTCVSSCLHVSLLFIYFLEIPFTKANDNRFLENTPSQDSPHVYLFCPLPKIWKVHKTMGFTRTLAS